MKKFVVGAALAFVAIVALAGASDATVNPPLVDIELTPDQSGYWLVDSQGAVTYVDAPFHGDRPSLHWGESVVSMSSTPDGGGYWLFTTLGRVIPYGNADHLGDMAGVQLARPVIDSIATPSGDGYYMVAEDGGIFTFGDARFRGSMGGRHLNRPVNGLAPTATGNGYWLVADDGGIFSFGDARFHGSMGGRHLNRPVVGMIGQGEGYLLLGADGGIFNFGSSRFHGSLGGAPPRSAITAVTVAEDLSGYTMVTEAGTVHPFGLTPDTGWAGYPEPGTSAVLPMRQMSVGVHIQPGTYRIYPNGDRLCEWNRDGAAGFSATGPLLATVRSGDTLSVGWCWLLDSNLSSLRQNPAAPFGPGTFMVHRDVRPGTWRSSVPTGTCRAETLSGFDGGIDAPNQRWMQWDPEPFTVTIKSTDLGFHSTDACGTWTRVG